MKLRERMRAPGVANSDENQQMSAKEPRSWEKVASGDLDELTGSVSRP